jgi:hypothetical protein
MVRAVPVLNSCGGFKLVRVVEQVPVLNFRAGVLYAGSFLFVC